MRTEGHAFFRNLAQLGQAENLEAARVSEDRTIPGHEAVQAAHFANRFNSRPQIKMVGIAEQNLDAKFLE